jgi:undecaprenyl diphosphate synthase
MESSLHSQIASSSPGGLHVAIIMDGNGRWATRRGLPREAGHHAGVAALRRTVEAAPRQGIGTLTVYAFSAENWRRPETEVSALMLILRRYLELELARLVRSRVRVAVVGRRDRLSADVIAAIEHAERVTRDGTALHLRIALDYSARDAILAAAEAARTAAPLTRMLTRESFSRLLNGPACPDVDLVIRTSGEQRLSDFMLWESAYAELYFTERLWPDFDPDDLADALAAFAARERRFGGLSAMDADSAITVDRS